LKRLENQPLNSPTTGEAIILVALEGGWWIGEERTMGEPSIANVDLFVF